MTILTQSGLALQAVALALLDITGTITIESIYALTLVLGVISAFDNPARRGFVTELVPEEQIPNAVSLNTAVMTGSRIFGPAITATLVTTPPPLFVHDQRCVVRGDHRAADAGRQVEAVPTAARTEGRHARTRRVALRA